MISCFYSLWSSSHINIKIQGGEIMVDEKWMVFAKKADFNRLGQKYDVDPVVIRVMRNRDVITDKEFETYVNATVDKMYSPWLLYDMENAVNIIKNSIIAKKKIRVIGDYDIDGVCSGHILTAGLEEAGGDVDFTVPDRIIDGYGINERIIKKAYDDGINVLVTCDNGIAAIEQIEYAKSLGMTVVVTDHHDVQYEEEDGVRKYLIPNADAVVNPKHPKSEYPFKELCGASVAYKVIQALFEKIGFTSEKMDKYVEFAGIATIGDVVELKDENRIIAKEGIKKLNNTHNAGLNALKEATGVTDKRITSYTIGFVLGPCLNAGGRLSTAMKAYSLLHTSDLKEADSIAKELTELNDKRKDMTVKGFEKACEMIDNDEKYNNDSVLLINLPECHESIVGIIAGRIREKYNKPVIVFTEVDEGLKGSGRSIEEYNMFEKMVKCRKLFKKFGGHAMAAGLTIEKDNFEKLRKRLNDEADLSKEDLTRKIWIDVPMPLEYISEKLVYDLDKLEPFGKGNEKPVFAAKDLIVDRINIFGKNRNVVRIMFRLKNGFPFEATYFTEGDVFAAELEEKYGKIEVENAFRGRDNNIKMSVVYYPDINEFNGRKSLRVIIRRYMLS